MPNLADAAHRAANTNAAPAVDPGGVGARLESYLATQESLCARLEALADALPRTLRDCEAERMLMLLSDVLERAHRYEEETLHPYLRAAAAAASADMERTLSRLAREHLEDRAFAEEIGDSARAYAEAPSMSDANRLGYMLRGFFEGLRRHIAFEREHILPLLRERA